MAVWRLAGADCEYSVWQCGDWPVRTVSIVCGSVETGRCGLSIESDRTESGENDRTEFGAHGQRGD